MSKNDIPDALKRWLTLVMLFATFIVMLSGAVLGGGRLLWSGLRDDVVGAFAEEFNLDALATVEDVAALRRDIHTLRRDLSALRGDNDIIRISPGRSYIEVPVYVGDRVELVLHIGRTPNGASCTFTGAVPLFLDTTGISDSGEPITPARQLDIQQMTVRLRLTPPPDLIPGRVALTLEMAFDCDGETRTQTTDPFVYFLEDRPLP